MIFVYVITPERVCENINFRELNVIFKEFFNVFLEKAPSHTSSGVPASQDDEK